MRLGTSLHYCVPTRIAFFRWGIWILTWILLPYLSPLPSPSLIIPLPFHPFSPTLAHAAWDGFPGCNSTNGLEICTWPSSQSLQGWFFLPYHTGIHPLKILHNIVSRDLFEDVHLPQWLLVLIELCIIIFYIEIYAQSQYLHIPKSIIL